MGDVHLYVIALDKAVLERKKFRERNPDYIEGKPCSYVGITGRDPDIRYAQHKDNYKANRYARDFGTHLQRRHCANLGPISWDEAEKLEREKAAALREKGWAVWQG